ncbi:hypothetical protein PPE03_33910 [Pseudoalteromonas peptidolytica]|nr:hypothetical protein PPE03_33910 [Pseudoalteromonas peptidolytica]
MATLPLIKVVNLFFISLVQIPLCGIILAKVEGFEKRIVFSALQIKFAEILNEVLKWLSLSNLGREFAAQKLFKSS